MTRRHVGSCALLFAASMVFVGCKYQPQTLLPLDDLEIVGNLDEETICFLVPYQYQIQTEGDPEPSEFEIINIPPGLAVDSSGSVSGNPSEAGTYVGTWLA